MFWAIGFLVLLVALLIPILAIVLDAPAMRHLLERRFGDQTSSRDLKELTGRVAQLEDDLEDLGRSVQTLKDETQFLQHLLENPEQRKSLTPPKP
jgi:outer membrane murein-binding lipoprotein Lpp